METLLPKKNGLRCNRRWSHGFSNRYPYKCICNGDGWMCGPDQTCPKAMLSRRKILSRSRDELSHHEDEEDVWFQKDKLFKDHIHEVLSKWNQIDDEIWAKIICMERNRRVAKAYARAPVLTINGSDDGFDGYRIGLCGFENPLRDAKTEELKRHITHGVKVKMDECGNIMVKRVSKANVYIKEIKTEENSVSNDIIKAGGLLEMEKPTKLFDMKKFTNNVNREIRKTYPDRRKLESQCISIMSFVKDWPEVLDCSCWVMIINIVALDMLKSKLPLPLLTKRKSSSNTQNITDRYLSQEEDPCSVPAPSARGTLFKELSEMKPPQLPPRDLNNRVPVPLPDYDDSKTENMAVRKTQQFGYKDDPYCCGMKARVPNFAKKSQAQKKTYAAEGFVMPSLRKSHSAGYLSLLRNNDRSPTDSGRGSETGTDEDYARVYGRARPFEMNYTPGQLYIGEWE